MALLALASCGGGVPEPASLDTSNDACASCRMAVSDARYAAQLVAPGEETKFFDDIGCLAEYLRRQAPPPRAVAYVADHRTKAWVPVSRALYTRIPGLETTMGSHLIAHADAASRDADPGATGGSRLPVPDVFGAGGPPDGTR